VSRIESLSDLQKAILSLLKQGKSTLAELSETLDVSFEAVRRQVHWMHQQGFVDRNLDRRKSVGRPQSRYTLTPEGEHLFPKSYDDLAVELIDHVAERLGTPALEAVLESFIEARVRRWEPSMEGKSLPERLSVLQEIYREDDPHTSVESGPDGYRLIERDCPFFNIANRRPALCQVTEGTLSRLLGHEVVREEKFQEGHGRCVFRVLEPLRKDPSPVGEYKDPSSPE
jgi:predicted ArsR family transcriptional regulator